MAILVECGCGVRKQVPDDWAGKIVTCKCGARICVGSRRTEAVPPSLPEKPAGDVGAAPVILTNPSKGSRVARKKKTLSPLLVVGAAAAIFVVGIGILIAIFALDDAR